MDNGVDKEDDTVRGVGGGIDAETKPWLEMIENK